MTQTSARSRGKRFASLLAVLLLLPALPALAPPAAAADTFTVNSTADPGGDGTCDAAECTLREAIEANNDNNNGPEVDLIRFAIPGKGLHTIAPMTELPEVLEPVTIDGYTQPGAKPNTAKTGTNARLRVELDGSQLGTQDSGLVIRSDDTTVRGLVVNGPGGGNGAAIEIVEADRVAIVGNFVGTDAAGTEARANLLGIFVNGSDDGRVGGGARADRNLISGNVRGMSIAGSNRTTVAGNLIGTDRGGRRALGNQEFGLSIRGLFTGASANTLTRNVIACNGTGNPRGGVMIEGNLADGNRLDRNSMFRNEGGGIVLLPGGNNNQPAPVLSAAEASRKRIRVEGTVAGDASTPHVVQLFLAAGDDPAQGRRFLGQVTVTTDGAGEAEFVFRKRKRVRGVQRVVATATNDATGNTSEFSEAADVGKARNAAKEARNQPPTCE